MKKYILILLILAYCFQIQAQGLLLDGFMQPKGQIVSALGYSHEFYDTYYVGNKSTQNPNLGTIKTNSVNLYVTGGITDFLNVTVNLPYVTAKPTAGFWSPQQDFQDLSIFIKGRLFQTDKIGNFNLIGGLGYILPSSNYIADAPISIGHQAQRLEARLIAQYRLANGFFIMAQGGYSHASNVESDRGFSVDVPNYYDITIRSGGNIGFLYTDVWLSQQNALSGTNIGPGIPFPSNAVSFLRSGFNLYGDLPFIQNLGLSAGMGFTLNGENVGKSTRISTSLIYRFSYLSKK
jgi:hypothetical protein